MFRYFIAEIQGENNVEIYLTNVDDGDADLYIYKQLNESLILPSK